MSFNTFGNILKITTFGESHGAMLGVVIDGLQSNFPIDTAFIQKQLDRRRPGFSINSTSRKESDTFEIVSGFFNGKTTGTPLTIVFHNNDQHSNDYEKIKDYARPGHADLAYQVRYKNRDYRGGGRSSGRETVCRVAAGAIAMQILSSQSITISSKIISIKGKKNLSEKEYEQLIQTYKGQGESLGGRIQVEAENIPIGLGEPVFDKLDALISHAIMSIGAVKGIEFGSGFASENLLGSENNKIGHSGGISGGLSDGEKLHFEVAVKPTPSVSVVQQFTDLKDLKSKKTLSITGRHDPCICYRILPVLESMTALVLLDCLYAVNGRKPGEN